MDFQSWTTASWPHWKLWGIAISSRTIPTSSGSAHSMLWPICYHSKTQISCYYSSTSLLNSSFQEDFLRDNCCHSMTIQKHCPTDQLLTSTLVSGAASSGYFLWQIRSNMLAAGQLLSDNWRRIARDFIIVIPCLSQPWTYPLTNI